MNNQKKLDKLFKVLMVTRGDISGNELMTEAEVLKLTDEQMEKIGDMMGEGLMGEYWNCLELAVDYIKTHCMVCKQRQDDDGRCGCTNKNQK